MDMASIAGWCVLPLGALWQFLIIVAISFIIVIISMMNFIIISACHRRPLSTVPLTLGIQMAACLFMPLGDRLLCLLPALPCPLLLLLLLLFGSQNYLPCAESSREQ